MRKYLLLLTLLILFFEPLQAEPKFIIRRTRTNAGFFSAFLDIISGLDCYEKGFVAGLEVDYAKTGLYYDPLVGPNWWNYYFKPICVGNKKKAKRKIADDKYQLFNAFNVDVGMTKERANELITRYIKIREEIEVFVNHFKINNFDGNIVIGIHYRGTDKVTEAPRLQYEKVREEIEKHAKNDCLLFVATDEQQFLDYMIECYGTRVLYLQAERSTTSTPLHLAPKSPYQQGKEALLDCLLLSKTDLLLRTSSNLSLASTYFNPLLPVIELSRRH